METVNEPKMNRKLAGLILIALIVYLLGYVIGYNQLEAVDDRTFLVTNGPLVVESGSSLSDIYLVTFGAECGIYLSTEPFPEDHKPTSVNNITIEILDYDDELEQLLKERIHTIKQPSWYRIGNVAGNKFSELDMTEE